MNDVVLMPLSEKARDWAQFGVDAKEQMSGRLAAAGIASPGTAVERQRQARALRVYLDATQSGGALELELPLVAHLRRSLDHVTLALIEERIQVPPEVWAELVALAAACDEALEAAGHPLG
jgi:hypothetical protein